MIVMVFGAEALRPIFTLSVLFMTKVLLVVRVVQEGEVEHEMSFVWLVEVLKSACAVPVSVRQRATRIVVGR